ncbi:MAG: signal peptidase I [Ruminococcaceae bacterium]|nr:signal peptidase I [Oscillospiraceae bacterium]
MLIDNEQCINLLKEELNKKGELQLTVHGDSMLPNLNNGDVVKVQSCNEYNIGDIIAYYTISENNVNIIVHRVIFVREKYVLAKGDNNSFIDPIKIDLNSILGKAEKIRGEI